MSHVHVAGIGCVSPAGWGVTFLREAIARGEPIAVQELKRPGWAHGLRTRPVPAPIPKLPALGHARLRRASPISQYAIGAALEALSNDVDAVRRQELKLGLILATTAGSMNYSRRFYSETLKDPSTASPLVFPETVFNAPASHIAAFLGTTAVSYTLVGDAGTFATGLATAAAWLDAETVDACLVIGAEELDWLVSTAVHIFSRDAITSEGAGAVYLKRSSAGTPAVELAAITDVHSYVNGTGRDAAAERMRRQLEPAADGALLVDSTQGVHRLDAPETAAWAAWTSMRISPKRIVGEGLVASAAWQCVTAVDEIREKKASRADVSLVGLNQQAVGVSFRTAS